MFLLLSLYIFFFIDTATTEIYTLSLHDALPISADPRSQALVGWTRYRLVLRTEASPSEDRKSTRLNSSHLGISYAVFCLKKKKKKSHNCPCSAGTRNNSSLQSDLDSRASPRQHR